jgi:hypothetical protein
MKFKEYLEEAKQPVISNIFKVGDNVRIILSDGDVIGKLNSISPYGKPYGKDMIDVKVSVNVKKSTSKEYSDSIGKTVEIKTPIAYIKIL